MRRTVLISPVVGSAIPAIPLTSQKKGRFSSPFFELWQLLFLGLGLRRLGAALGPVVVGREGIRREVEALRRHDQRRVLALRLVGLLEEGTLGGFLRRHGVPHLQERGQDVRRRAQDADPVLGLQLGERLGVLLLPLRPPDRKSTRLNSSHGYISYAVFCLKKKIRNAKHN